MRELCLCTHSKMAHNPYHITRDHLHYDFYVNNKAVGEIVSVSTENLFTVALESNGANDSRVFKTFKLEQQRTLHREFFQYHF